MDHFVEVLVQRKKDDGMGLYVPVWACSKDSTKGPAELVDMLKRMEAGVANDMNEYLFILGGNHNVASNVKLLTFFLGSERKAEFATMKVQVFCRKVATDKELMQV
jgi:hypothetical protein